jgi:hypothetical protein
MARPIVRATVIGIALALLTAGALVWAILGSMRVQCEVCVTFRGQRTCRTATGATPEEARRTATDNACAFLASGMTDGIACANTPPDAATCTP